jgi:hypothetical protein
MCRILLVMGIEATWAVIDAGVGEAEAKRRFEQPVHGPRGIRHVGGAKLDQAVVWNVRTWPAMPREKIQAATTARSKVPMRRTEADCSVVVRHRAWPTHSE